MRNTLSYHVKFLDIGFKNLCITPQKLNLASKLRGCIQKEQSKVILALPTNNSTLEIFERTITGGLSCLNTHLSFDTENINAKF